MLSKRLKCAVALTVERRALLVLDRGLDGEDEFGEGRGQPMPGGSIQPEFVVAAAEILDEGMSGANHAGAVALRGVGAAEIGKSRLVRSL